MEVNEAAIDGGRRGGDGYDDGRFELLEPAITDPRQTRKELKVTLPIGP